MSRKQRAENQQARLSVRKKPRSIQKAMHRIRLQFSGRLTRQAAREHYKAHGLQNGLDDRSRRRDQAHREGYMDVASGGIQCVQAIQAPEPVMPKVRETLRLSGVRGIDDEKSKGARKLAKRQRKKAAKRARKEE